MPEDLPPITTVEEGIQLIMEKMQRERPTLRQYLRDRAAGEDRSSREWEEAHPGCAMAAWRSGASYAYGDTLRMLERDQFSPESADTPNRLTCCRLCGKPSPDNVCWILCDDCRKSLWNEVMTNA